MEEINCIFCDHPNESVIIEENGYKGRKCSSCGLIYISPRPTFEEIVELYKRNSAHRSAEAHIAAEFARRLYARHTLRIIGVFKPGGKILELGSGAGYFLDEARKRGYEPFGIEFNPVQAKFIREKMGIPCEEKPLDPSSFEGTLFDVVYHCDVISHFYDPIAEFEKFNAVLAKGGYVVFETGNLGEVEPRYLEHVSCFQYPDHLFFFNTRNLEELLSRTGFELVRIYRYSILPELRITNALMGVILYAKYGKAGKKSASASGCTAPPTGGQVDFPLKKIIKRTWNYFTYLVRYKLGSVLPKEGRPQTMIVVARKRD
jgi:SAM-dependent methyltransferase